MPYNDEPQPSVDIRSIQTTGTAPALHTTPVRKPRKGKK